MNNTAEDILNALKASVHPILCMDSRADFDAVCSSAILHDFLTNTLGKDLYVTFDGTIPDSMKKLTSEYANIDFIKENVCPATDVDFSKFDLQIFLDSGNIDHICKEGKFSQQQNIKRLNIDHHAGNPFYGDLNFIKKVASSCTTLYTLFKEAGIEINKNLANVYYLGVLLDSGFFQYDTVSDIDFLMASELKILGAKCYEITWKLTFNERLNDMKLKGLVYSNLVSVPELKTAYSTITLEELKSRGIDFGTVAFPASDMLKRLENTDFVFVVREDENNKNIFNVSFRSHVENYDVTKLAKHFGGGGHKMAAGGTVSAKNISSAVNSVLEFVKNLKV